MKQKFSTIIITGVMLLSLAAVAAYIIFFIDESEIQKRDNTPAAQALLVGEGKESFTDMEGNPTSVSEDFGKIIIVTSWASWCPQCTASLNDLGVLAEEYKDRGVIVLAINRAENRFTAERFLKTITVPGGVRIILDPSDHYFGASAGYAMPETILYTKDGQTYLHQRGNLDTTELRTRLDELLK
jgi:thiol-disulfide isomerase/thioredoxin